MTLHDEGKQIRSEVSNLRPDKRRRYPPELRRRILDWVARAKAAGRRESECGHALGVKTWRLRRWRRDARTALGDAPTNIAMAEPEVTALSAPQDLALVRVDLAASMPAGLHIISPSGYRIEGLSFEQAVALLREVA